MCKKNVQQLCSFLLTILLMTGCKKELNEPGLETDTETAARGRHGGECRLTSISSEFGDETYTYNNRGLLDELYISGFNGYFKQEYNKKGRMIKSRFYSPDTLVNTIFFVYSHDRVAKEIWYRGNTTEKTDEVFYSYDSRGLIRKSGSFMGDYATVYKHTPEGNVSGWTYYVSGKPAYASSYTYLAPHHKNPYQAIPGLEYGFGFINGAYNQNKWYSTSEKDVYYDEAGNEVAYNDQDPTKTVVEANRHNYVTVSDFYDILSGETVHFKIQYENCGPDDSHHGNNIQKRPLANNGKINPLSFIRPGSAKTVKEQVARLQKYLRN